MMELMEAFSLSASKLTLLFEYLEKRGITRHGFLERIGLDPNVLEHPDNRVPLDVLEHVQGNPVVGMLQNIRIKSDALEEPVPGDSPLFQILEEQRELRCGQRERLHQLHHTGPPEKHCCTVMVPSP
ncbi:MAG TPA: hypothetical protein ENN34_05690 [Deltaproteobacteria bacterium]|nr:hypothetical protein [Deltaproteobacteria bacterium]